MENLVKIQNELIAPKGQYNAFAKFKYRSQEDILEAVKPLLVKYNCTLTLSDEIIFIPGPEETYSTVIENKVEKLVRVQNSGRYYVKATATFTDGKESITMSAFAREDATKKGMDAAQVTGSSSSYARKYVLSGLFLCDNGQDADTGIYTIKAIENATSVEELEMIWRENKNMQKSDDFITAVRKRKEKLLGQCPPQVPETHKPASKPQTSADKVVEAFKQATQLK